MTGRYEKKQKKRKPFWLAAVLLLAVVVCCFFLKKDTPESLELRLQEKTLIRITDSNHLNPVKELLAGAEDLGYEPKTFLLGLELIYTGKDGRVTVLELDMDSDLFRYEGRFFDYGPGNDNNAMPELLTLLGLEDWPEEVKDLIYNLSQTYPDLKERIFGAMQRYPLEEWGPQGRYKRPKEQE